MDDIIRVLPDSIANQIAAGEVIQRPASVVKELMENAIDAGASKIDVRLKDAGRNLIQVIDNGMGMSPADAKIAFERHSTSKLRTASDLFHLKTMGFRGEALASIAAVAHVELVTKRAQDELAWKVEMDGSALTNEEQTIAAQGSRFTIRNLFFNIPARRKFLGDNAKELRFIREEFIQIALVNPDLELSLTHNDELIYQLGPGMVKQRVTAIFGKRSGGQFTKLLYPVDVRTQLVNISGFVGDPAAACQRDPLQYFFVNGRFIRHRFFRSAVLKAYETLIPSGMQPAFFLYFEVDPEALDVNIHPTKTEVKFEHEQAIWPIVHASVREALGKFNAVPSIDFDREDAPEIRVFNGDRAVNAPKVNFDASYNPFKQTTRSHNPDWDILFTGFQKENSQDKPGFFPEVEDSHEPLKDVAESYGSFKSGSPENSGSLFTSTHEAINADDPKFQLYRKYIVIENNHSLVFIDQHRAHVRILYEHYLKQLELRKALSQILLFPVELHLDTGQLMDLQFMADDLQALGFKFDYSGLIVKITAIPVDSQGKNPDELVIELMSSTHESVSDSKSLASERLALSMAKAVAIPDGKILSPEEMDTIIAKLLESTEHKYTPDGKIICSLMTPDELLKRF